MDLNKIIRSLDLAKSDARDKTIESIIEYILFSINEEVSLDELNILIKEEILLEIHRSELEESLVKLVDEGAIETAGKKFKLTTSKFVQLRKTESENGNAEEKRYENFSENIVKYSKYSLSQSEIKILWTALSNYIYECYLEHGKYALNIFSGRRNNNESEIDLNLVLRKYESTIPTNLRTTLKNYVENFSNEVTPEGLEYLLNLADKAEAFFALGLSKDEYNHIYEEITFDWTVFVDTNFLYSILDLHSHPESEAAKAVVEIGKQLKIKFKYLNITLQELQNISKDFNANIPRNLHYSQIQALVKSDQLDNFSLRYFEKKLDDMENTPHPIDVVGHAINNLKSKGIDIFRYPFDRLSSQEEYLKDRESSYNDYLKLIDETRIEKGMKMKRPKDAKQVYHDVFLREAIIFLRDNSVSSINDIKYIGVTLDKRLIKYDNYLIMKRKDGINIPNFFSPSIFLKKLLKYSPVQSEDYRRAFIKTISTPALDNNYHTSKVTIRSVKYFNNMGISDEKLILNAIKDEIFLSKFKELENDNEMLGEFVESEIQKKFVELYNNLEQVSSELMENKSLLSEIGKDAEKEAAKTKKLEAEVLNLQGTLQIYDLTLKNINKINHSIPHFNPQISLETEAKLNNVEMYLSEIRQGNTNLITRLEDLSKSDKYYTWKRKSYFYLIPIFIIVLNIVLVFFWQNESWNYMSSLVSWFEKLTDGRKELLKPIVGIFMGFCLYKPVSIVWKRNFSKDEREKFFKQ